MAGVRMAAPLLALQQGTSGAGVGLLLALLSLAQLLFAVPAGRFCDRQGLRRPLAISVGASTLAAAAVAIWPRYLTLCVATLLTGGACGLASIALQRRIAVAAQGADEVRQAFAWLSLGPALANALGPLIAGFCIDHAGWRQAFLALAVLPLASWLCARFAGDAFAEAPAKSAKRSLDSNGRQESAWSMLKEPSLRRLMLVNWVLQACWDTHTLAVPLLAHERGFSASETSMILASFALGAAAIRALLPFAAGQLREWAVFAGSLAFTSVALAAFPLIPGALALAGVSVLLGLLLGGVQPMAMSTLYQITPSGRHGEALGLRLVLLNATSAALPAAFGVLGAGIGISFAFWVMSGFATLAMRPALALRCLSDAGTAPLPGRRS